MIRAGSVLTLLAALAFVAAGCGSHKAASPEEVWAGTVCSEITTWQDAVTKASNDAITQIRSPKAGTLTAVDADIQSAVTATNDLTTSLQALGPPNTPAGAQAKEKLDTLATQLHGTVTTVKTKTASLQGASIAQVVTTLTSLAPELESLATTTKSALDAVQASGSALQDGFKHAGSCAPYRTAS